MVFGILVMRLLVRAVLPNQEVVLNSTGNLQEHVDPGLRCICHTAVR